MNKEKQKELEQDATKVIGIFERLFDARLADKLSNDVEDYLNYCRVKDQIMRELTKS